MGVVSQSRTYKYKILFIFLILIQCQRITQFHDSNNSNDRNLFILGAILSQPSCSDSDLTRQQSGRIYQTSFESVSEFSQFYSVPQNYQNATTHGISNELFRSGAASHKADIYAKGPDCLPWVNCNHRGYPTIQLHKTAQGGFSGTVFAEFYVYLNMTVADKQWFSFATFSADKSDSWDRVVLVNLGNLNTGTPNFVHLMHAPYQGQSNWSFQTSSRASSPVPFPSSPQWVKISTCLNLHPSNGFAKVWQNDILVSEAQVRGGCNVLQQAHFGLYAYPGISTGSVFNEDLLIQEVSVCPK